MAYIFFIFVFVVGLSVGSFINVLVFRSDNLKSVIAGRSHCPNCQHNLAWYDLVPLVSFIMLRGKCRYCGKKISIQYPLVELSTGLIFLLLALYFGVAFDMLFYAIIMAILMVVVLVDIRTQMVPEQFVWAALILALAGGWYFGEHFGALKMIYGVLVGALPLAILSVASREKWMGYGDVKIGAILGALTGFPASIFVLMTSFILGAVVGLVYMKVTGQGAKTTVPFAPFLVAATLLGIFFGESVVKWYLGAYL